MLLVGTSSFLKCILPSITHDRYSAASNEGLQNGTQSSLPVFRKPWDGRVFRIIEGSRAITSTKLYKKPMASDDCDDICGHYWGDKLMDTLQVDGL